MSRKIVLVKKIFCMTYHKKTGRGMGRPPNPTRPATNGSGHRTRRHRSPTQPRNEATNARAAPRPHKHTTHHTRSPNGGGGG